jgi:hypothetical protein
LIVGDADDQSPLSFQELGFHVWNERPPLISHSHAHDGPLAKESFPAALRVLMPERSALRVSLRGLPQLKLLGPVSSRPALRSPHIFSLKIFLLSARLCASSCPKLDIY